MQESLEQLIKYAKLRFNRRDYEQFVSPIIKRLTESNNAIKGQNRTEALTKYISAISSEINNQKEQLQDKREIIEISCLYNILDTKKGDIL
jgi:hypothetical protein